MTITASPSRPGYTSGTASLSVKIDVAKTLTVQLSPSTISEGDGQNAATGTVTVTVGAQRDLIINLTSSNNAQATVTSSVTILAGHHFGAVRHQRGGDGIPETSANTVTITAIRAGSGYTSGTATLTVNNTDVAKTLTLQIDKTTFSENAAPARLRAR